MSRVVMISKPKSSDHRCSLCRGVCRLGMPGSHRRVFHQGIPAGGLAELGATCRGAGVFDANAEQVPTLTAVGCTVVSSQPGRSDSQKRLMAIRSARMAAMRDLAEQIHGLRVDSSTTVIDLMVQNDTFRGVVSGTIRGARTVRINPTGSAPMKSCSRSTAR